MTVRKFVAHERLLEGQNEMRPLPILPVVEKSYATHNDALRNLSLKIHQYAECAYHEYRSSHLLSTFMEDEGFLVERGVGEVKTAFSATYSQEGPVVSFNAVKHISSD